MNIFVLSEDPVESAQMMCDSHVIKMILESAQLLSTAHRVLDGTVVVTTIPRKKVIFDHPSGVLYKATHVNHPCGIWVRFSDQNYAWLYMHFVALCDEYTYRFGKVHATDTKLRDVLSKTPKWIPHRGLTEFVRAMKNEPQCIDIGTISECYRAYYRTKKNKMKMKWTKRETPEWFY